MRAKSRRYSHSTDIYNANAIANISSNCDGVCGLDSDIEGDDHIVHNAELI
jgi:hypothetical protein